MDNFDDRYLGAKASDPSLDNDGNALAIGALYFNTTDGVMKVYTASGWIAASSASVATLATFEFVATSGQTVFSGNDANGSSLSYVAPAIIVTLNGVRLRPGDDYTATNGTSITLVSAAALNDELVVDAFGSFLVANTVDLSTNQTVGGIKTFSNDLVVSKAHGSGSYPTVFLQNATAGTTYSGRIQWRDGNGNNGWNIGNNVTVGTNYLEFNENTTPRVWIEPGGRVRTPYQPAFHVQRDNGNFSSVAVIPFNSILTNRGSHYSTSTNRFTAPTGGVYHFYASVLDDGGSPAHQGPRVGLRVNGTMRQLQQNFYNRSDSSYNFIHVELTIELASSDYVDFYNESGGPIYGGDLRFGYFGGYLIG